MASLGPPLKHNIVPAPGVRRTGREEAAGNVLTQLKEAANGAVATRRLQGLQTLANATPVQRLALSGTGPLQLAKPPRQGSPLDGRKLTDAAFNASTRIMAGTSLTNAKTIEILSETDAKMSNWSKWTTPMYGVGPKAAPEDYQVHYYYNSKLNTVCMTRDYKKKFRNGTIEYI